MAIARAKAPFHRGAVEMPDKQTIQRARADKRAGKSASTQAGEFVKGEIDKIRGGEHGAKNAKQAIAIGLSEARRAGVDIPDKRGGSKARPTKRKASSKRSATSKRASPSKRGTTSKSTASSKRKTATKRASPSKRTTPAKRASP